MKKEQEPQQNNKSKVEIVKQLKQELIEVAKKKWLADKFMQRGADFHKDDQAVMVGWYIRLGMGQCFPVYQSHDSLYAVDHNSSTRVTVTWKIEESNKIVMEKAEL